jgi:small-conductance mechanosensitive channel
LLLGTPAAAQDATPEPTPSPAPTPRPIEPIPLPRVATESEAAERAARRLERTGDPQPAIVEIETLLTEREAVFAERLLRARTVAADPASLIALEEEIKSFELATEELGADLSQLTERITGLEAVLDDVTHHRAVWKATERTARAEGAPEALLAEIRETRRALRDAAQRIEDRRDELLTLQGRLADAGREVAETVDTLLAARGSFRSLLLLRDAPPLWEAVAQGIGDLSQSLADTWQTRWQALTLFFELRTEWLLAHLVLLAAALAATLTLRRKASAWRDDDPRLEASAVVFERPVSAALLMAVAVAPLLHPLAPSLAQAGIVALVVVPTVRLLPRLLPSSLVPAVYALAGFALVDSLRDVIAKAVVFERSLLLLETAAALVFLVWMLRPSRLRALPPGARVAPWLRPLPRVAAVALALSVVANVAGWMNLARSLADGVLGAAYAGVVLYGGARILHTLLRAGLRSRLARGLGLVRRHGREVANWSQRLIDAGAWLAWLVLSLAAFGVAEWTGARLGDVLGAEASFGAIAISLGDVLAFALTVVGALVLSRLLRTVLEDDVLPRVRTARGVPLAVTSTVHYVVLFLGFVLAISAAGVDLNRVSLLAGALGVGIGFGLQNVVNNFVSGLILLYERPIQLGDMIEVGGLLGEVKRIGIRSSTIRTVQGAEVIVPNGNLISDQVVNWTFSDRRRRVEVKVGVAYGTDPERVLELLRGVAAAHPQVLPDPEPAALFLGFGDSSLDFELRAWTPLFESWMQMQSELAVAVNRAIVDAGIEIPFPQRDLHLRTAEGDAFGALRRDEP